MAQSRIFYASIDYLHEMLGFICAEAKLVGFDSSAIQKIEIASEEAIVNVIHHSYSGLGGEIEIAVLGEPQMQMEITISDTGAPFDAFEEESKADVSSPLDKREIGGLGLLFIRNCLDEVRYRREGKWNVLTLIKKI
jgi:anti-sigma regulatory factor (Ser/Thr protein kinase)